VLDFFGGKCIVQRKTKGFEMLNDESTVGVVAIIDYVDTHKL